MRPLVGGNRPLIKLKSVVLPAPLGPMMAWRWPVGISRLTPRMISVTPKLWRPFRSFGARGDPDALMKPAPAAWLRRSPRPRRGRGHEPQAAAKQRQPGALLPPPPKAAT